MGEAGCSRARGSRAQRHLRLALGARHRRDAASKKVEGVTDLGSAHREGRREPDGGATDEVDEQPVLEAVLEDARRELWPELQADKQALPARLRAGNLLRELPESVLEDLALNRTSSRKPGSLTTLNTALTAAIASGLPPKVEPWLPGPRDAYSSLVIIAPTGTPPPRPLALVSTSGITPTPW